MMQDVYKELVGRTNLDIPVTTLLERVTEHFGLGAIIRHEPILEGYEDLNIKLKTDSGKYVVKAFSKEKRLENHQDYVRALVELPKAGVPVAKIIRAGDDSHILRISGSKGDTLTIVMEFFEGKSFDHSKPGVGDVRKLTCYIARFHNAKFSVSRNYDSWGAANLLEEFEKKKNYLSAGDLALVRPIVKEFRDADFSNSRLRKCVIHGDIQRKHVLKDNKGNYCILDLGCMDYSHAIFDIGVFLATFAFNAKSASGYEKTFRLVVAEYQKANKLNDEELNRIHLAAKACYCTYLLSSSYLLATGNRSQETLDWLEFARRGLRVHRDLNIAV
ncbi:phosphotransferase [Candidatus Micrarchaeota archaeon]|nr:phosphotransferase [Candidatus Micrarchaeota archaeon]